MENDISLEKERIRELGKKVRYNEGFNSKIIEFVGRTTNRYYYGSTCLVLGPSIGGELESELKNYFKKITCVDGSEDIIASIRNVEPSFNYHVSLFENFYTDDVFDTILINHVLEHVKDPVEILNIYKNYLTENGKIIITVPNANSLHRLIGMEMNLLKNVTDLNEGDIRIGHRRVYTFESLEIDIQKSGMQIEKMGGILLKPLSNCQMTTFSGNIVNALYTIGTIENFQKYCAEIYAVCYK